MLITDILSRGNRQHTDAYFQGQQSGCVGGWNRLFSLLGYSSSGSIQMPKSSIVWPHSNGTIVQSRSDCATVTTVYVCFCVHLSVCVLFWWYCVCVCVQLYHVCVRVICAYAWCCVFAFPEAGAFSLVVRTNSRPLKCSRANADPIFRRCRPATVHGHRKREKRSSYIFWHLHVPFLHWIKWASI